MVIAVSMNQVLETVEQALRGCSKGECAEKNRETISEMLCLHATSLAEYA